MSQNLCALNQFISVALHERIVSRDIGLAFGAIDQQCLDISRRPGRELHCCRKPCAAHSRDTRVFYPFHKGNGILSVPIGCPGTGDPLILSVGF